MSSSQHFEEFKEGGFKSYWDNGQLRHQCYYINDKLSGEFLLYADNGELRFNAFYVDGQQWGRVSIYRDGAFDRRWVIPNNDITNKVIELVDDPDNITDEEKLIIHLRWGIPTDHV